MFCKNCGTKIVPGAKFCTGCGTPVTDMKDDTVHTQANPFEQTTENRNNASFESYDTYQRQDEANTQDANSYQTNNNYRSQDTYREQQEDSWNSESDYMASAIPNRSIALYIVLTIVTCGIFGIYWAVVVVNDLNIATQEPHETSGIVVLLLGLVTCNIYTLYWMYKAGNRLDNLKVSLGGYRESRGIIYLLLSLFSLSIVAIALIQSELNKLADGQV